MFSGFSQDRGSSQKMTISNCFNGARNSFGARWGANYYMFHGASYLRNVTMVNCLNTANIELADAFWDCPRLADLTLTNVARGQKSTLTRFFNSVGNACSGTVTWRFTDFGNNSANLRALFRESFKTTSLSSNSSITWGYTPTGTKLASGLNADGSVVRNGAVSTGRGNTVSMGQMFSNGSYTSSARTTSRQDGWEIYSYDYSQGSYDGN